MAALRGSSFADGTWNDEGLFFTIVVHSGFAVIFLIVALCLHGSDRLKKLLRPARPHSSGPRFATTADTAALFQPHENEVAMRVSVRAAIQLLLLKYRAFIFIGGLLSAISLTALFGTDDFLSAYAANSDVFDCKSRSGDKTQCENVGWCVFTNGTTVEGGASTCAPTTLHGLYDLSLLNVTPTHYRSWIVGLLHLMFHLWAAYCIGMLIAEVRVLVFASKVMPVQLCDTQPLASKIGSRAVRMPVLERQCRHFDGTAASLFPSAVALADNLKAAEAAAAAATSAQSAAAKKDNAPTTVGAVGDAQRKKQESADVLKRLLTKHVTAVTVNYEPPVSATSDRTLAELMGVEHEIVEEMAALVAEARNKRGSGKNEHREASSSSSSLCCSGNKLEIAEDKFKEVRTEIEKLQAIGAKKRKKLIARQQQQQKEEEEAAAAVVTAIPALAPAEAAMTTATTILNPLADTYAPWKVTSPTHAFIVFDRSAHAARFLELVEEISKEHPGAFEYGDDNSGSASAAADQRGFLGPSSHLAHEKLAPSTCGGACKTIAVFALYIFLVLLGTGVVAFFASIDRFASMPVISDSFGPVVRDIPAPLFRILQAYVPVVLLALFQLGVPPLVRSLVHGDFFRVASWELRSALSFRLVFVFLFVTGVLLQATVQGGLFTLAAVVRRHNLGDVLIFLTSMFTPKGGYFFALVASSTTCSQLLQLLLCSSSSSSDGESDKNDESNRENAAANHATQMDLYAALSMFIFSIGILYHSTSPLLCIFVCLYFVAAYYCTRAVTLDVEDRSPRTNPASDATTSNDFALAQIRYMLGLHTLATVGTFVVLCFKYLWGGAAMSVAPIVISCYLWHLKGSVLDPVLDTKEQLMVDHFEHMQGFFAGKAPAKASVAARAAADQEELEAMYLPEFARYDGTNPWPQRKREVLQRIEAERGRKYEAQQGGAADVAPSSEHRGVVNG